MTLVLLSVSCRQATSLACLFIQQILLDPEQSEMNLKSLQSSEGNRIQTSRHINT